MWLEITTSRVIRWAKRSGFLKTANPLASGISTGGSDKGALSLIERYTVEFEGEERPACDG